MSTWRRAAIFALALAVAGCARAATPTSISQPLQREATPTPTAAPTPTRGVDPSPTPTSRPLQREAPSTLAAAPTPTTTPTPTLTPTATPTVAPTPTLVPTPTATVEACRQPVNAQIVSGPSEPNRPQDSDSVFRSLTVHPRDADIVVLGTERNGFVRTTDGGTTWTRLRAGLGTDDAGTGYSEVWDIAFAPSDPSVLMAATLDSPSPPAGPRVNAGLYKSTDGGGSWTRLNCGFTTSRVTSVRFHPTDANIAIAGLEGGEPSYTGGSGYFPGGIFRTVDGGENWQRIEVGPNDGRNGYIIMTTVPNEPSTLITFGTNWEDRSQNVGFIRSTDAGVTWTPFAAELRTKAIGSFAVSADGNVLYANEDGTYFGWVSRDAGATWSQSAIHQVNGPIAVSPQNSSLVVFASQSRLRRSTNGLGSVSVVATAPAPFREIVFAPSNPSVVYAETDGYLLYRSDDAGATWRFVVNVRDDVLNVQP